MPPHKTLGLVNSDHFCAKKKLKKKMLGGDVMRFWKGIVVGILLTNVAWMYCISYY